MTAPDRAAAESEPTLAACTTCSHEAYRQLAIQHHEEPSHWQKLFACALGANSRALVTATLDLAASLRAPVSGTAALAALTDRLCLADRRYLLALAVAKHAFHAHPGDSGCLQRYVRRTCELSPGAADADSLPTFYASGLKLDAPLIDVALALPMIFTSEGRRDRWRLRYERELTGVLAAVRSGAGDLSMLQRTPFFLAYQGHDDTPLQRLWGQIVEALVSRFHHSDSHALANDSTPSRRLHEKAPQDIPGGRKIAFISAHARDCTVQNYFSGWSDALMAAKNSVTLYSIGIADETTVRLAARVTNHFHFDASMGQYGALAAAIRLGNHDLIIYPEVGMQPLVIALAATRLAPRQACASGHPVTTGLSTIDTYISGDLAEPDDPVLAQSHYVESLMRLPGMGTALAPPDWQGGLRAVESKNETPAHLRLICAQALFKWQPEFIEAVGQILERLPQSKLYFFAVERVTPIDIWLETLSEMWRVRGIDVSSRLCPLAETSRSGFLQQLARAELALDTFGFSGGQTTVDTLTVGLPVVTLPGSFMRGRQTAAMLKLLDVTELCAVDRGDYVDRVCQLAGDETERRAISKKILKNAHRLFDDERATQALTLWAASR